MRGFADSLVRFALDRPRLIVAFLVVVLAGGVGAFFRLDIEAYPDPVPPMVDVIAQGPGLSAAEVERSVTEPIEEAMSGLPHLATVRTVSLFGLSDTKLQFTYDVTYAEAEQLVINVLSQLNGLPSGVTPQISPESPIGEIYRYRLRGPPELPVTELKTIEDQDLEQRFKSVLGVIDVVGWGGATRAATVAVDLDKLDAAGVTLAQVLQAITGGNQNVGGRTIQFGGQAAVVRGVGAIGSLDAIRDTLVAANGNTPVLVRDVAGVTWGEQPRLGIAGQDDDNDIVQGIVLMRRGEHSLPTIRRVEAEAARINASGVLPPGVRLERIYDRSDLVGLTVHTVLTNLFFGIALIFAVQWIFLGDLRSALVVAATIPFALAFAIILLVLRGESANLLSVGAIDFGLIVDATVILVENIFRHLREAGAAGGGRAPVPLISRAVAEVDRAVFFSAAVIVVSFVPLFTLSGIEGHIFGPMARTYAYAILGGLIATFTVSPALSALLLPRGVDHDTRLVGLLRRTYRPALDFLLANGTLALGGVFWLAVLAAAAAWSLGLEFLPHLEERNLWIRATMPLSISLEEGNRLVNQMRATIRQTPEVVSVISQQGRPDDGTDATGFFNAEFYVPLKPRAEWRHGIWTQEEMAGRIEDDLRAAFPGVSFNFSQYIEDNVEELASGVKGENSVKLYGDDLATLEDTAVKVRDAMRTVFGITDLAIFNALGQLTLSVETDRARAARFGLSAADVNTAVQAGIGGQNAGTIYESATEHSFPIILRLAPQFRDDVATLGRIGLPATLPGVSGTVPVPLAQVARIGLGNGPAFIYRENQQRYVPIKFSVRFRALGGAVREAQKRVAEQVVLPPGVRLEWVGEFRDLQQALARLSVVVPVSLALIGFLLFAHFGSFTDTLLAASVMPLALVGGVFALAITGTPFSVSAAIGFVGLFGISVMEAIIVISTFNALVDGGAAPAAALRRACETRLRPVMMTCLAACVGLFPAAVSRGIGAQVQRPLAIVVVGGSLLAPMLILAVLPVLIQRFSPRAARDPHAAPEFVG